jgi:alpha-tubulin suppressor-like RCC1 family protein
MIGKNNMKKLFITFLAMVSAVGNVFSQSKTITGGNDHGLIICAQGYLYTWGNNYSKTVGGPLLGIDPTDPKTGGNATKDYVTEPSRVKSGNLTFSQVTAGSGAFNLALACNSVVYAWGENTNGGCGQGDNGGNVIEYPVPVLKGETSGYDESGKEGGDYLGGVTYIAASTNSGFAIMDDGRVVGWGGGTWNGSTNKTTPVYIKDKDGNDITNVTHISGGDDNCLIRTADGKLYGIGPWNGSKQAAVTYATPVLKEEDKEELTDIRMSAAGDVCGFAVTGDGFVWSWGNGGWGGSTGVAQTGANHPMARKVSSGEYKSISGEEYLTDVKEVIGGRGHGAAVTKEGYLVYWGCDEGNGGIAPVDAATAKTWASGGQGVKPVLARYCDASGKPGDVVKNAVSISRGDNFDFMMNDEDKYFVWGLNDLGQCGVGRTVSEYNCLVELKTIPCDIQNNCPEVFMTNQVKCRGEEIELDCGFVVPKG